MELKLKIRRFDPSQDQEAYFQDYTVQAEPSERLLDCLNRIKWQQDDTLAFRASCAHGICGSDAMRISGQCGLACQKLAGEYQGREVVLEPLPGFKVLKDLIVDMAPFLERVRSVKPYLQTAAPPPEGERLQSHQDSQVLSEVIRCILCACCMGECPVVQEENPRFLGPAPLVWAFRFIFDSRDDQTEARLRELDHPDGAWGCQNYFKCTETCPKEIRVTRSINLIKREIEKRLRPQSE